MSDKTKKDKKPATEKKQRAPRKPMRTFKDSPAGHFADKVIAHSKALAKIAEKCGSWGAGAIGGGLGSATTYLTSAHNALTSLAAEGFKPDRKRGGGGLSVVPGMKLYLRADAVAMLNKDLPHLNLTTTTAIFASPSLDAGDKVVPCRLGPALTDTWLGRISKKMLSAQPVA